MRIFVLLAVLHGLVPGLGEVVETAIHLTAAGHLAHSRGEKDLGNQGREHSCGVTLHNCGCCATQAIAVPARSADVSSATGAESRWAPHARRVVRREPARPFRPPIA